MVIEIPAFERLRKVNRYTKSSFRPSGCSAFSRVRDLAAAAFPPSFISRSSKECMYLTKTFYSDILCHAKRPA
jgi:hypothetical protein